MKNKNLILGIGLIIAVLGVIIFWLEIRKTSNNASHLNQEQLVVNNQNVQGTTSANEKQSKTLDNLLSQAEEMQLLKIDTVDWKKYQNKEMGFDVKLPQGFDITNPKITRDAKGIVERVCLYDKKDVQHYATEGSVNVGSRYVCFKKFSIEQDAAWTTSRLIDAWKGSSDHFKVYDINGTSDIVAKLHFGYGSGVDFDQNGYHWSITDSHEFDSENIFGEIQQVYYFGIMRSFNLIF